MGRYFIRMAEERGWMVELSRQEVAGDAICISMNFFLNLIKTLAIQSV